jgi:hypothetical protein
MELSQLPATTAGRPDVPNNSGKKTLRQALARYGNRCATRTDGDSLPAKESAGDGAAPGGGHGRAAFPESFSGLNKTQAEELLDWLEANGHRNREVTFEQQTGFTVRRR